jgi:hypothetical protein
MRWRFIAAGLVVVAVQATTGEAWGEPVLPSPIPSDEGAALPAYTLEVDSDESSVVSYDALAARLSSELRAPVALPNATPARAAITINYRKETRSLVVRARHAGGPSLERSIIAQGDPANIQAEAILLASNLARDEARELLDELSTRPSRAAEPVTPPSPVKPEVPHAEEERWAATVGVAYPLATNRGHPNVSSVIDLSVAYGRVGRSEAFQMSFGAAYASRSAAGLQLGGVVLSGGHVGGLQLGLGSAIARGPVDGVQLGGLASISDGAVNGAQVSAGAGFTHGRAAGAQIATGFNYAGGGSTGTQLTAGANIASGPTVGMQGSVGANIATGDMSGVQATAGANIVGGRLEGVQASSLVNVATKEVTGVQATAGVNVASDRLSGGQAAVVNVAGDLTGAQIGIVNIGRKVKGLQLGLLNIADEVDGAAIGLVTITKDSIHPVAWGGNLAYTNAGIKFTTKYVYTLVAIGFGTRETELDGGMVVTNALGGHIPIAAGFDVEAELAYTKVESSKENHALHPRVLGGYAFAKHLRVFAGGGPRVPIAFDRGSSAVRPEVVAGLQF